LEGVCCSLADGNFLLFTDDERSQASFSSSSINYQSIPYQLSTIVERAQQRKRWWILLDSSPISNQQGGIRFFFGFCTCFPKAYFSSSQLPYSHELLIVNCHGQQQAGDQNQNQNQRHKQSIKCPPSLPSLLHREIIWASLFVVPTNSSSIAITRCQMSSDPRTGGWEKERAEQASIIVYYVWLEFGSSIYFPCSYSSPYQPALFSRFMLFFYNVVFLFNSLCFNLPMFNSNYFLFTKYVSFYSP
jgi:hypothetical protein